MPPSMHTAFMTFCEDDTFEVPPLQYEHIWPQHSTGKSLRGCIAGQGGHTWGPQPGHCPTCVQHRHPGFCIMLL